MKSAAAKQVPAVEEPAIKVLPNCIVLRKPIIELERHIFVGPPDARRQTNRLTPDAALIAHGEIIVEEMDLIVPLTWAFIRSE